MNQETRLSPLNAEGCGCPLLILSAVSFIAFVIWAVKALTN